MQNSHLVPSPLSSVTTHRESSPGCELVQDGICWVKIKKFRLRALWNLREMGGWTSWAFLMPKILCFDQILPPEQQKWKGTHMEGVKHKSFPISSVHQTKHRINVTAEMSWALGSGILSVTDFKTLGVSLDIVVKCVNNFLVSPKGLIFTKTRIFASWDFWRDVKI